MTYRLLTIMSLLGLSSLAFATATTNWQTKAQSVCTQLNTAAAAYAQNDMKQAHLNAVMAYFQNYDLNIEPSARKAFTQAHIFTIEQQFSDLNKQMVDNPTAAQIKQVQAQTQNLCAALLQDGKTMDADNITLTTVAGQ